LREGRGDAGIITSQLWNGLNERAGLERVWISPSFSHCVFTAAANFDKQRAARFTQLMQDMRPDDRDTRDVMRLEGTKKWLPGSADGFQDLVEALRRE
jgi:ABC-type phosphate/phosphonate transport system substrate-binding protein